MTLGDWDLFFIGAVIVFLAGAAAWALWPGDKD